MNIVDTGVQMLLPPDPRSPFRPDVVTPNYQQLSLQLGVIVAHVRRYAVPPFFNYYIATWERVIILEAVGNVRSGAVYAGRQYLNLGNRHRVQAAILALRFRGGRL